MAHAPVNGRFHTGTVVFEIVQIGAIHDRFDAQPIGRSTADAIKFVFAKETAIDGILTVGRVVELMGFENDVTTAQTRSKALCRIQLAGRNRSR
jgi:hypothetical protein